MTLGEFIKKYRAEHDDMSIRAFARMVGMSPQQVLNIERGIGSNGEPMQSSTLATYKKIAEGIGMSETGLLNLLDDNVRINPSDEKIPITKSDGQYMVIELDSITDAQRIAIQEILNSTPQALSAALPEIESLLSSAQVPDDSEQSQ